MKLTINERVLIPAFIISQGTLHQIRLSRDLLKKIEFTADEIKKANLDIDGNIYTWSKDIEVEIKFSKDEQNHLKESAKKADKDAKVTDRNIKLIEKLIE